MQNDPQLLIYELNQEIKKLQEEKKERDARLKLLEEELADLKRHHKLAHHSKSGRKDI